MSKRARWDLIISLALLLAALALRVYRLPEVPPGLHSDEAYNGVDVLGILNGQHPIFFEANNGREPLFIYLQAISVALLGTTPFALRLVSAVVGALTVPAVYWCVKEAFTRSRLPARQVALWTALFVAFSYWHLNFSRIGYRAIMLPLMVALIGGWFWRAWYKLEDGGRLPWVDLVLCGLCLGIAQYTYTSARFVPLLMAALVIAGALATERSTIGLRRAVQVLAVIGAVALLVFAPLGAYFIAHPSSFLGRAASVSILDPGYNQGSPWQALGLNIVKTAGMFGVVGDTNWRHNPAARPAFDPLLGAWVAAGIAWALARRRSLAHLFGLLWLIVLALPALFSDGAPHTLRALGIIPGACLLAVIAMLETKDWLECALLDPSRKRLGSHPVRSSKRARYLPALGAWLPLPFLLFSGYGGIQGYFKAFPHNTNVEYAFDTRFVAASSFLQGDMHSGTVWLIPVYPLYDRPHPDAALTYLSGGHLPNAVVLVNEDQASAQLRQLSQRYEQAGLVEWPGAGLEPDGAYALVDWKHLVKFMLAKYGQATGERNGPGIRYTTYTLTPGADYRTAGAVIPRDVLFGGQVRLTGIDYGPTAGPGTSSQDVSKPATEGLEARTVPSGQPVWAVLRWQAQTTIDRDLKASLFLIDAGGHLAGQVDDVLASDHYLFERNWEKGAPASTYHILPMLPAIPPGRYSLNLAVYDAATLVRYPVISDSGTVTGYAATVGELEVTRARVPATVTPAFPAPNTGHLPPGLVLLGFDLPKAMVAPGEVLSLTLYWQAEKRLAADYHLRVMLQSAGGAVAAQAVGDLIGPTFPATAWQIGDIQRGWYDISVPATTQGGKYQLVITVETDTSPAGQIILGDIEIAGRPHQFTAPAISRTLQVQLGNQIALRGYDLDTAGSWAGGNLRLTLYWQALAANERLYAVFVHLLASNGQVAAQKDSTPGEGALPTTSWLPGEFITDPYSLTLPDGLPPGSYQIEIGMYDPTSGARLPVTGTGDGQAGDRVLLPEPIQILAR